MRIAVVSWGASRGDFEPFLALAVGFQQAGHQVKLGSPPEPGFAAAAAQSGVPFWPLGSPMEAFLTPAVRARISQVRGGVQLVQVGIEEFLAPNLEAMYRDCLVLAEWADVVVSSFIQPAGRMAAETFGRPLVTATYAPDQIPTRFYPPMGPNLGSVSNRLLWRILFTKLNEVWASVNRVRRQVGLKPLDDFGRDGLYAPRLNLVGASRHAFPPPPDWAPRHQLTGHWFLDRPVWFPPPELERFVRQGPKPIVISLGFGGIIERNSSELTRILLEAIDQSGVRAVVVPGGTTLAEGEVPPNIMLAEGVPFGWLLPQAAAVVHHGGAGSTHHAFRAGVPSVVMPFIGDQHFWARTAARLGVATPPLPRRQLTADRLFRAIQLATTSVPMSERAARLGELVREENGLAVACELVERTVGNW